MNSLKMKEINLNAYIFMKYLIVLELNVQITKELFFFLFFLRYYNEKPEKAYAVQLEVDKRFPNIYMAYF